MVVLGSRTMTGGPKKGDLNLLAPKQSCSGSVLTFLERHLQSDHVSKNTLRTYTPTAYRNRGSSICTSMLEYYRYSQQLATHPKKTLINIQLC
jgi:hypothetical protein